MTELLDRLRSRLGGSYRIERELTGGMSRVFVAEDVQLARKAVLKVFPADLAGEVNLARFPTVRAVRERANRLRRAIG